MRKIFLIFLALFLVSFCFNVMAQTTALVPPDGHLWAPTLVKNSMANAVAKIMSDLQSIGIKLLFGLSLLQLTIIGYGQIQSGEIDASLGKFARAFIWISFCVWMMSGSTNNNAPAGYSNGSYFLKSIIDYFISMAGSWTVLGASAPNFSPTDILTTGLNAYGQITLAVGTAMVKNPGDALLAIFMPSVGFATILMTFFISVVIMLSCLLISIKVFMVTMEAQLVIAISPLSFSFLGLNAMRDQGFAPLKSGLALIFRIIVLGAVVSGIGSVSNYLTGYVNGLSPGLVADVWDPLLAAMFAYVLLGFLAYKSDQIATSLANGSASLGSGDVAGAVAAGVSTGMAGAAGMAALKAMTGGQSMMDFVKNLGQSGGAEISNAGASGSGGFQPFNPSNTPMPSSSLSMDGDGEGGAGGGGAGSSSGGFGGVDSGAGVQGNASKSAPPAAPAFTKADGATAAQSAMAGGASKRGAVKSAVGQAMERTGLGPGAQGAVERAIEAGKTADELAGVVKYNGGTSEQADAVKNAFAGASEAVGGGVGAPAGGAAEPNSRRGERIPRPAAPGGIGSENAGASGGVSGGASVDSASVGSGAGQAVAPNDAAGASAGSSGSRAWKDGRQAAEEALQSGGGQREMNAAAVSAALAGAGAQTPIVNQAQRMAANGRSAAEIAGMVEQWGGSGEQVAAVHDALQGASSVEPTWMETGSASGGGGNAGIAGNEKPVEPGNDLQAALDNLGKHASRVNDHVQQERQATHVSIGVHQE